MKKTYLLSVIYCLYTCLFVVTIGFIFYLISYQHGTLLSKLILVSFEMTFVAVLYSFILFFRKKHAEHIFKQENEVVQMKVREHSQLIDSLFSKSNVGMALLDKDKKLIKSNKALHQILGYSHKELANMDFTDYVHPQDRQLLISQLNKLSRGELSQYGSQQKCRHKRGDDKIINIQFSVNRDSNNSNGYIVQVYDITSQKNTEQHLRQLAFHDPLTGLSNRHGLEHFMEHTIANAYRNNQKFAVLFLDIDSFKTINDTIGHDAGDYLLQVMSDRLKSIVRNTDIIARLGGDEFVIILANINDVEAVGSIAQKIITSMKEEIIINKKEIYATTSVGVSIYPNDGETIQELMKHADLALYRAKDKGKNNYQFYNDDMTVNAQRKMRLQNALAHALKKDEFILKYQPKVVLSTGKISGVEALLRWQNDENNDVSPKEMIAIAEESGLIIPVGLWTVNAACEQLKKWHDEGYYDMTVSLNCSEKQMTSKSFIDEMLQIISNNNLAFSSVQIEVTEKIIMNEQDSMKTALNKLKTAGVKIAIDDFGTGYWSLRNLKKLPIDEIKIDNVFIDEMLSDPSSHAIISAVIAMLKRLSIQVVAEGVETREQFELLENEGCDKVQGYYLSKPLTVEEMDTFLTLPAESTKKIFDAVELS